MITALLSRLVDLLLAVGLPRTPQLPMLLSPNSTPPLELLEGLLHRRGMERREVDQENIEKKKREKRASAWRRRHKTR